MTFQEIQELIKLLNKSNIAEFKMENGDFKVSVRTGLYAESRTTQVVTTAAPVLPLAAAPVTNISHVAPVAMAPAAAPAEKEKPAETPAATKPDGKYLEIKSPMVGTFYRSASPEKPPYVEVGAKVKKGDVVCIIEAMKLFNEIESEVSGTIVKPMANNSQPVEYDQVLFLVEPD